MNTGRNIGEDRITFQLFRHISEVRFATFFYAFSIVLAEPLPSIFIQPPSIETLRHRLLSRGTDSIEAINQRVGKAAFELTFAERFDRVVVNDILREAVDEVEKIIKDFVNA